MNNAVQQASESATEIEDYRGNFDEYDWQDDLVGERAGMMAQAIERMFSIVVGASVTLVGLVVCVEIVRVFLYE